MPIFYTRHNAILYNIAQICQILQFYNGTCDITVQSENTISHNIFISQDLQSTHIYGHTIATRKYRSTPLGFFKKTYIVNIASKRSYDNFRHAIQICTKKTLTHMQAFTTILKT